MTGSWDWMVTVDRLDNEVEQHVPVTIEDNGVVQGPITVLEKKLAKARVLIRLLTVRQVIQAGDEAINAAGLNPWCLNEGLADGDDKLDPLWLR